MLYNPVSIMLVRCRQCGEPPTKACQSIAAFTMVHYKVFLLRTPLPNNAADLFGVVSVVDPVSVMLV